MTTERLNLIKRDIAHIEMQKSQMGNSSLIFEHLKEVVKSLCNPLPFHEVSEKPEAGRSGWRISQNDHIAFGAPEFHYELYLPQVFSEDTVGWCYESDILNLFHEWKGQENV